LLDEKMNLPNLISIDGGKGQLSAALKSLDELGLRGKIELALQKARRTVLSR
jgi:excinuclease ABC subunit C